LDGHGEIAIRSELPCGTEEGDGRADGRVKWKGRDGLSVHLVKYRRTVADGHGVKVVGTLVMDGELSVKSGSEGGVSGSERCNLGCYLVFADKGSFGGGKLDRGIIANRSKRRVVLWWLLIIKECSDVGAVAWGCVDITCCGGVHKR
jgi:hypothetical protein